MPETLPRYTDFLPNQLMGDPGLAVSGTAEAHIRAPAIDVFDWFTVLDISRVLNGYAFLPGVEQTFDQHGNWTVPGETRRLEMSGGIRATQEILVVEHPLFFAYRVSGFTHVLDLLAHGAEARWWFDQQDDVSTIMRWTYTFWPRSIFGKIGIYPVIKTVWTRYMQETIQKMKRIAEEEINSRPEAD